MEFGAVTETMARLAVDETAAGFSVLFFLLLHIYSWIKMNV